MGKSQKKGGKRLKKKELAKMLEDVDDMIESYAGKDILAEPEAELEKYLSPTVEFDWKNLTFTFLPHQIADLQKLIDALESTKPDFLGVADIEQYKPFMETLAKYQQFANVKNTGAAIHAMIKCTEQMFDDIGYVKGEIKEWSHTVLLEQVKVLHRFDVGPMLAYLFSYRIGENIHLQAIHYSVCAPQLILFIKTYNVIT